jgi:hypothetical protein
MNRRELIPLLVCGSATVLPAAWDKCDSSPPPIRGTSSDVLPLGKDIGRALKVDASTLKEQYGVSCLDALTLAVPQVYKVKGISLNISDLQGKIERIAMRRCPKKGIKADMFVFPDGVSLAVHNSFKEGTTVTIEADGGSKNARMYFLKAPCSAVRSKA